METGYGAVDNFAGNENPKMELPPELMRQIAMARMQMQHGNNGGAEGPQQAIADNPSGLNGLTPQAMQALKAIMVRRMGSSGFPSADTSAQHEVDLQYGPQGQ